MIEHDVITPEGGIPAGKMFLVETRSDGQHYAVLQDTHEAVLAKLERCRAALRDSLQDYRDAFSMMQYTPLGANETAMERRVKMDQIQIRIGAINDALAATEETQP